VLQTLSAGYIPALPEHVDIEPVLSLAIIIYFMLVMQGTKAAGFSYTRR
jgi:hypothetical protein